MEEKDFTVLNAQLAIFFDGQIEKPENIWVELNEKLGNIFDQLPMIISVPNSPDFSAIPVVQMRSSDQYLGNISFSRADFFMLGKGKQGFEDIEEKFKEKGRSFTDFFTGKGYKINRIGFIVKFFVKSDTPDSDISKLLDDNFVQGREGNSYEVGLKHVTRFLHENKFESNDLISLAKTKVNIYGVGSNMDGIEIMRDFNTAQEKTVDYVGEIDSNFVMNFVKKNVPRIKIQEVVTFML